MRTDNNLTSRISDQGRDIVNSAQGNTQSAKETLAKKGNDWQQDVYEPAKNKASEMGQGAQHNVNQAAGAVGDQAQRTHEAAKEHSKNVGEKLSDGASQVKDSTKGVLERVKETFTG